MPRYAKKVDSTQAAVVQGLRDALIRVEIIGEPCDLLCRFWCGLHRAYCWQTLECKPLTGKRKPRARIRADQAEQSQFLAETDTPVVTSFEQALVELNKRHQVGRL